MPEYKYSAKPQKGLHDIKKRLIVIVCIVFAIVVFVASGLLTNWFRGSKDNIWSTELQPDPLAIEGTFGTEGRESAVPEGNQRIVLNRIPTMETGDAPCNIRVENVPGNAYAERITILDENGSVLYRSMRIDPGYTLSDVTLNQSLSPGEHEAVVEYEFFNMQSAAEEGRTSVEITIRVLG